MKILLIFNNFTPPDQPGLPRPYEIAAFLRDDGHEVTVIANCRNYLDEHTRSWAPGVNEYEGLNVIGVETSKGRRESLPRRLFNYVTYSASAILEGVSLEKQDVVITATPPLVAPIAGLLVGWRHRARTVLDIGDLYPGTAVAVGVVRNPVLIRLWDWWEDALRRRYDHLVACVPHIYDSLMEKGHPGSRVTLIPNGVDLDGREDVTLPEWLREELAPRDGRFNVVYGGAMGQVVNLRTVLEAAKLLRGNGKIHFLFFGDGDFRGEYERYVEEEGLSNCRFHDPLPREVIREVFGRADALIHSYYDDDFFACALPNKIFDYHGAGRPLVFAGRGSSAELIDKAGSGIVVEPEDARQMADAVEALAGDRDAADTMGRRGREFVEEHYARRVLFRSWRGIVPTAGEERVTTSQRMG